MKSMIFLTVAFTICLVLQFLLVIVVGFRYKPYSCYQISRIPTKFYAVSSNQPVKDRSPNSKASNIFDRIKSTASKTASNILSRPKDLIEDVKAMPLVINNTFSEISSNITQLTTTASNLPIRISSSANEITNKITAITTTVRKLPTDLSTSITTTTNFLVNLPAKVNNSIVAYQNGITSKVNAVTSTSKAIIKFPGKVVSQSLKVVKGGINTYYDIVDRFDPNEQKRQASIRNKQRQRVEKPSKATLSSSYEVVKESIYSSYDTLSSISQTIKSVPNKTIEFVSIIQNLPETIENTKEDINIKIMKFNENVDNAKVTLNETSQYVYRVITLQEAKKAYAETVINIENTKLAYQNFKRTLANDPLSLITGKPSRSLSRSSSTSSSRKVVADLPRQPIKVAVVKSEPSLIEQIGAVVNTTVNVAQVVGSGVVATASFTARIIEILAKPSTSSSSLPSPSKVADKPNKSLLSTLSSFMTKKETSTTSSPSSLNKVKSTGKEVYTTIEEIRTITEPEVVSSSSSTAGKVTTEVEAVMPKTFDETNKIEASKDTSSSSSVGSISSRIVDSVIVKTDP